MTSATAVFRAALCERSGGWCEARLVGCTSVATDVCHRIASKMGGRPKGEDLRLSNVWHGCRSCHMWATHNPTEAYVLGLAVKEGLDTACEPMVRWDRVVLLDDDGDFLPVTEIGQADA